MYYRIEHGKVLRITDTATGQTTDIPLPDGRFTLEFIHSVHKTPVYESYLTDDENNLILVETVYDSYGVGMPFSPEEGNFEYLNGKFRLTGQDRKFKSIDMLISALPQHRLVVQDQAYPLVSFCGSGGSLRISAADKWYTSRR